MALSRRAELVALYPLPSAQPATLAGHRFARFQASAPLRQPLDQQREIPTIGAERIFSEVFLQPQRVEKLFDECEILFHISPFGSAIWPLCLIAIGFWYTTRKVIARIEIVTR